MERHSRKIIVDVGIAILTMRCDASDYLFWFCNVGSLD